MALPPLTSTHNPSLRLTSFPSHAVLRRRQRPSHCFPPRMLHRLTAPQKSRFPQSSLSGRFTWSLDLFSSLPPLRISITCRCCHGVQKPRQSAGNRCSLSPIHPPSSLCPPPVPLGCPPARASPPLRVAVLLSVGLPRSPVRSPFPCWCQQYLPGPPPKSNCP